MTLPAELRAEATYLRTLIPESAYHERRKSLARQADLYDRAADALEWRGIESAPKDGTFVLVHMREYDYEPGDQTEWVANYDEGRWWYSGCEYAVYKPSHWRPLDAPLPATPEGE